MRESGFPLSTDERSPLLQLIAKQTSQKEVVAFNSKAINAIFSAVSIEKFKKISNVEVAHTAWNILQTRLIWLCFNGSKNKHDPLKNKVGIHE